MDAALTKRALTVEMVESVGSCDQFDETYTRRQSRCGLDGMTGRRGDLVLDALTRPLLHGLPGGDGVLQRVTRRVKNSNDGLVNIFSDNRFSLETGLCTYFGLERMAESEDKNMQTMMPGVLPSPRRQQQITTGFNGRTQVKRWLDRPAWKIGNNVTLWKTDEMIKCFYPRVEKA
ncbi:hypothetical protein EVAR_39727_1 [Eumeta japonica]|uniref:Uncharacterized protein n=1 Tax=Eumeta variegata TaxID=151549 RepID=A0A4C1W734_EUMVA|nr:hypothetical protein EVAR_39727_1 [Eumeta japonica]